jgi:hypothetical protein
MGINVHRESERQTDRERQRQRALPLWNEKSFPK